MLTIIDLSEQQKIKSGHFGKCGRMIIKPVEFTEEEKAKCKKALLKNVEIAICGCWIW